MTRYNAVRYNAVSFGLQLLAVSVGAFTDFLVGKLTNKLSLAVLGWLAATIFMSALLALFADKTAAPRGQYTQSAWASLSRWFSVYINQSRSRAAWPSIVNAAVISLLATCTYAMLMLAFVVMRYAAQVKSPHNWLGPGSPFDQFVVAEAVKYQLSHTALEFTGAVFLIGLILRPPFVLPAGIMAVGVVNAASISLPPLRRAAQGPPTQLVAPVSRLDGYLLRLHGDFVVVGCLALLAASAITCWIIHHRIEVKNQLTRSGLVSGSA